VTTHELQVLTVLPHMAAVLLCGALRAEGVRAELERDVLGAVYGLDSGGHATRVLVRPDDVERARAIVAALDTL
jgi:hypothetical protein